MPIISQMICSGSGAAISSTKSQLAVGELLQQGVDDPSAFCPHVLLDLATAFGVNPWRR